MNNNKITIRIQRQSDNNQLLLSLSPQRYKQQFKHFIKQNNLKKKQVLQIKKIVINKIRQIAYNTKYQQQNNKELQSISQKRQSINYQSQSLDQRQEQQQYYQQQQKQQRQYLGQKNQQEHQQEYQQEYEQEKSPTFSPIQNYQDISSIIFQTKQLSKSNQNQNQIQIQIQNQNQKKHRHLRQFQKQIEEQQTISLYFQQNQTKNNYQTVKNQLPKIITKDQQIQTIEFQLKEQRFKKNIKKNIKKHQSNQQSNQIKKQNFQIARLIQHKQPDEIQFVQFPPKKYFLLQNYKTDKKHFMGKVNKHQKLKQSNHKSSKQSNLKSPKINKNKSQSKSNEKSNSKSNQKHIQIDQRQLNHQVFFRLNSQFTSSFKQKFLPQPNRKEQKDEQQIKAYLTKKSKNKSPNYKLNDQVFDKLHFTSTESSFNRYKKSEPEQLSCNDMEIQKFININLSGSGNKYKRIPNMQSKVYSPTPKKRCNEHCQQHEYQKRIKRENTLIKQKEENLKKMIKSRSKQSDSWSNKKRSGQCSCCHYDKIQQSIKKKNKLLSDKKNRDSSPLKGPNLKIKFISDVLEESYQSLFQQKG